jgi:hypothetical protein
MCVLYILCSLLRATSRSTERQCATIDNKGGGEGVRERFVLGGKGGRGRDGQKKMSYVLPSYVTYMMLWAGTRVRIDGGTGP